MTTGRYTDKYSNHRTWTEADMINGREGRRKMKYKVGDEVKIRSDLKAGEYYGADNWASGMNERLGKIVTIDKVLYDCHKYKIAEDKFYTYTDEMFESKGDGKLKAYELMKLAAENPHKYEGKKYKVVDKCDRAYSMRTFDGVEHFELIVKNGKAIYEGGCYTNCTAFISSDTELEEIKPEPVGFMEAMKAIDRQGKTVECRMDSEVVVVDKWNTKAISPKMVLCGNWYIKE